MPPSLSSTDTRRSEALSWNNQPETQGRNGRPLAPLGSRSWQKLFRRHIEGLGQFGQVLARR